MPVVALLVLLVLGFLLVPVAASTIRVAKDGSASYSKIQAAIAAALPGDRVYVAAGTYEEAITLKDGVSLQGERSDKVAITFAGDSPVLTASGIKSGGVEGITVGYTGAEDHCTIFLFGSTVTITACVVTSSSMSCIDITGGATPIIENNIIRDGKSAGILIAGTETKGTVRNNEIYGNAKSGIEVREGAAPIIENNIIRDGKSAGILIAGTETKGTVRNNEIYGNASSGISVSEGAAPIIENNSIRDGKSAGIYMWGSGTKGTVRGNQIYGNAKCGIEVSEGAAPVIVRNTIVFNKANGIWAYASASPTVTDNIVALNGMDGVDSTATASAGGPGSPVLSYNDVWSNTVLAYHGITKPATDISVDPLFVDAEHGDFRLRPGSPCLGAGEGGVTIGAASLAPSPTLLPADVVQLGDNRLRMVTLIQCASPQGRPLTSVLVSKDGQTNWIIIPSAEFDSGADKSMFPKAVADALGIDLSTCTPRTYSGVGGTTSGYDTEVYIAIVHFGGVEADVDGYILSSGGNPFVFKAAVSFTTDAANANLYLLGRRDVFDYLSLSFRGDTATVTVSGQ